jgi:uncharacterized protein
MEAIGSGSAAVDEGFECEDCGHRWYYTKAACPACAAEAIGTYTLETGVVESVTVVHATPDGVRSPNRLALARFDGVGLVAQVSADAESLAPGDTVRFDGEFTLREGKSGETTGPRLVAVP